MAARLRPIFGVLVSAALIFIVAGARADGNGPAATDPEPEHEAAGFTYTIAAGDTLSDIAVRFDVTVELMLIGNPGLDPDRIRAGQRIRIVNGLRRVTHAVRAGESLSRIAARYEVRIDEMLRWNRGLSRDRLRLGQELVVYTRIPESRSESIGTPSHGELRHGRQVPTTHPGLFVRTPARAFGTDEAVRFLVDAVEHVRKDDPSAPRIEVHDVSLREGGPMHGHHSHESGRDADIAYYQVGCRELCSFRRIGAEELDVARQWALFWHWLANEQVEAIFVDHDLQRALYEHARSIGVSQNDLSRWFQYPRQPGDRYGVIRHHPRHADHFHVRFVCHESDAECR